MSVAQRKYALELTERIYSSMAMFGEEPYDFDGEPLEQLDREELADFREVVLNLKKALEMLAEQVDERIFTDLVAAGVSGFSRGGQRYFRTTRSGSKRCTDPKGFAAWLAQGDLELARHIEQVYNPNQARKGGVRAVADARGENGDERYEGFFERPEGKEKLVVVSEEYIG